jgi:iron complex transport system substrate-binding protein
MTRWLTAAGCCLALWFGAAQLAAAESGPRRVVCIGGALTEIVYALGAGDRLVGVDTTSVFPSEAQKLPQVGYQRQLSAEGVLAQKPDLVIATADAGPRAVLRQLREAGIRVEIVPIGYSPHAVQDKVRRVAAALGLVRQGQALEKRLDAAWRDLDAQLGTASSRPRVLFILAHAGPALMVAGRETAADAMINLAGGVNALEEMEGYKPLSPEAVIGGAPEVILITGEGLETVGGTAKLWDKPGLAKTPAARSGRVVAMNALYLLGFGPRTPRAVEELARALHQP